MRRELGAFFEICKHLLKEDTWSRFSFIFTDWGPNYVYHSFLTACQWQGIFMARTCKERLAAKKFD